MLDTGTQLLRLAGRLHPMLVHFPIGLLVVAGFMEIWASWRKQGQLRPGIFAMMAIGSVSALFSAIAGLLLVETEQYTGVGVSQHQWGGIATTLLAGLSTWALWASTRHPHWRLYFRITLACTLISLTLAGHWGASLTHGPDYLSAAFEEPSSLPSQAEHSDILSRIGQQVASQSMDTLALTELNLAVRGIFAHHCYQCHNAEKVKGGLRLDEEQAAFAGGESGPVILPGKPDESELIRRISLPRDHEEAMPQKGKALAATDIELIRLWIRTGAYWADSTVKVFREAPLALARPSLPAASAGITHPVDRWVDRYFQQQGTDWPDPIDDLAFIRRIYLDITGLLPSPEHIRQFVADPHPEKRTRWIEALLEDDHAYTQHWLSFWNDLLRNDYSGTGFITGGRTQITDWLYQSLLENKPYDQMVRELLNPEEAAAGFIQGIRWRGTVNASQTVEMQAAQNISQSLMGLNLKCASCHNSFVSNLTLDQAYGMANIFSDTTLSIFRCDQPTGRQAKSAFIYPELGPVDGPTVKARLEQLAQVVVQPANGRLYRTVVNRLWAQLMGRGIVSPTDEMDKLPWDAALLDWLAADFIASGYDLKHTLKQILTSRAYQIPSTPFEDIAEVQSQQYVFHGPLRRRLSAEQFADALSQLLGPVYASVAYHPAGDPLPARWIWKREREVDRDILPKPGTRYFRYAFDLPPDVEILQARAKVTADHAFTLWINGQKAAQGADWRFPQSLEALPFLKGGKNILAVKGENEGSIPNPAGLLFYLEVGFADGSRREIYTDRDWKCTEAFPAENWLTGTYDDRQWEAVKVQSNSHWGHLLAFSRAQDPSVLPFARASLVYADPFLKVLGRPTRENVATSRDDRATLLQALELTNGSFFHERLAQGAQRWLQVYRDAPQDAIGLLYLTALSRPATPREQQFARDLLGTAPSETDMEDLLWALVLLPDFQLIY